jgi:arylsulfatase A-like enzyme
MGKQNLYDHSMHVPLILAGPGVPRGQRLDSFVYLLDLCPSLCEIGGVAPPPESEGRSLVPLLTGRTNAVRQEIFTAYRNVQRAVRDDRWKLIRYPRIDRTQLFDLQADPFERKDLSAEPASRARVSEMLALLARCQQEYGDTAPLTLPNPQSGDWTPPGPGKDSK